MDYAPDYRYYVSDIGRVWPVNGKYNAWQRELLQFVLEYHKAVLARIRPGVTPAQIMDEAEKAMEPVFARTKFSKPIYEQAARRLVETGGGVFSHTVGMAVHDVGGYRSGLKPGHVFSVDPQLRVPEENLYLRYEDTVVVTDTGVENFTDFLPMELDEMERLVREKGIVQSAPPDQKAPAARASRRREVRRSRTGERERAGVGPREQKKRRQTPDENPHSRRRRRPGAERMGGRRFGRAAAGRPEGPPRPRDGTARAREPADRLGGPSTADPDRESRPQKTCTT